MGFQSYISENEAASMAGVSVATLGRFIEAGYLKVETDGDGLRLFSKNELSDVFGFKVPERPIAQEAAKPQDILSAPTAEVPTPSQSLNESIEVEDAAPQPEKLEPVYMAETLSPESPAQPPAAARPSTYTTHQAEPSETQREYSKVKAVSEMLEKLLDMREREIADLKKERDWLRSRIEKAEEKSERDQLLLLSEAQMIRKLVSLNEERRSPLRSALVWIGLLPAPKPINEERAVAVIGNS